MANVFKRGGRWYYRFFRNGKRYKGSAGPEATKEMAEDLMAEKIREVTRAEIYGPQIAPITFDTFADDFLRTDSPQKKSKDRDQMILSTFTDHWPGVRLDAITTKMIADFKAERLKFRAAATVHKELQVLKRLFKMAVEWGRLRVNPAITVQKPKVRNNRVRHLTPEEITRLEAAVPDWLLPYVRFARYTGARRGEIFGLTWNDVDLKRGLIIFRDSKNGEDGTVEMNATTRALLEAMPTPMSRSQRVFPAVKIEKLRKAWQAACRKAKVGIACACVGQPRDPKSRKKCPTCRDSGIVPDFNFHDLRHQAATDLLTRGADLNDVRDFLRHKSMTMTLRYAHLVEARRKRTAHLLDGPIPAAQNWPQSGV